ncbi:MAG TPA: oligosaccharide flippase family protein [Propionibacteriaceae bacterium]|nr:oligosaccharide flippase family protein [Propionibacteriaceae bacterium]
MTVVTRTGKAVRNAGSAAVGQILSTVFAFVTRTVFIYTLGATYLGVNSLFTNVLAILSFAELGVGTAMTYALYGPLARDDRAQIAALMGAYAKAYRIIGITVAVVGATVVPFLGALMKGEPAIPQLVLLYLVFLSNSVLSYFISYSRSLVIASQNGHLDVLNRTGFALVQAVLQIGALVWTHSFLLYLVIQALCQVASNVAITRQARRMFPGILSQKGTRLEPDVRRGLVRNVAGMVYSKLGSAAVSASTSLFISAFVGVVSVGLYSNYLMITGIVNVVVAQGIAAVAPGVGNLTATGSREASSVAFDRLFFLNFLLVGAATAFLAVLLNPFITVWVGARYVLPWPVMMLVVVNFFLYGIRQTAITYVNACGLFWAIRWKSVVEAVISVALSVVFLTVFHLGIAGALLSVTFSTIATNLWWEPLVVMRRALDRGMSRYVRDLIGYAFTTLLATVTAVTVTAAMGVHGILALALGALSTAVVVAVVVWITYRRSPHLAYAREVVRTHVLRRPRIT